jgi:hypothetical protein
MNIGSELGRPNIVVSVEISDILFNLSLVISPRTFSSLSSQGPYTRGRNQNRLNAAKFSQYAVRGETVNQSPSLGWESV